MAVNTATNVRSLLLGAWKLVSWLEVGPDGTSTYPFGQDAIGELAYDASGRVTAQLARTHQDRFASDDRQDATAEEMAAAWSSYYGYFGTFHVDEGAGAVVHEIEGSWWPNQVGSEQVRNYHFDGNRLMLTADTPWGRDEIVWERLP